MKFLPFVFATNIIFQQCMDLSFGFAPRPLNTRIGAAVKTSQTRVAAASTYRKTKEEKTHFLLDEFTTYAGEYVNPYKTLKVDRNAERRTIRQAYITLSKRYHPDTFKDLKILPGKCNNLDEVREEWERVKLSYEILSNSQTRRRFDRHEMIADPGAALGRAAMNAAASGASSMGKGILDIGAQATKSLGEAVFKKDENSK